MMAAFYDTLCLASMATGPVGDVPPIPLCIVLQQRLQYSAVSALVKRGIFSCAPYRFRAALHRRVKLVLKGWATRSGISALGSMSMGKNCVSDSSPPPWSKMGPIILFSVLIQHRNVVQMPVIIEEDRIHFEKQRQILRKLFQPCDLSSTLSKISDMLLITGERCQKFPQ